MLKDKKKNTQHTKEDPHTTVSFFIMFSWTLAWHDCGLEG